MNAASSLVLALLVLVAVSLRVQLSSGAPSPSCCFPRSFVSSYEHFADQGGFQVGRTLFSLFFFAGKPQLKSIDFSSSC
jgi:hypothetical protein